MRFLLPLPIVLPLLATALCILVGGSRTAQRIIGLTTLTALVPIAVAILVRVDDAASSSCRPATGRRRSASRSSPTGCRRSCC